MDVETRYAEESVSNKVQNYTEFVDVHRKDTLLPNVLLAMIVGIFCQDLLSKAYNVCFCLLWYNGIITKIMSKQKHREAKEAFPV